jgi:hypothetical protein
MFFSNRYALEKVGQSTRKAMLAYRRAKPPTAAEAAEEAAEEAAGEGDRDAQPRARQGAKRKSAEAGPATI